MKIRYLVLLALTFAIGCFGCRYENTPSVSVSTVPTKESTALPTIETVETSSATDPMPTEEQISTEPESTEPTSPSVLPPVFVPAPADAPTWVANCDTSINFRNTPGGTLITTIPKGATMALLDWHNAYAKVNYNGLIGYVSSSYIMPESSNSFVTDLDIIELTNIYTYDKMISNIAALQNQYPDTVTVTSIGYSELGKEIPAICIGKLDAEKHVLLQGAMHAREHLTSWLLMALAEYWLDHGILAKGNICYHIIPMVNPDGVTLSQTQALTEDQKKIYQDDKVKGYTLLSESAYALSWKANGMGVDINRNFPSGWENIDDRCSPSSEAYQGTAPFSSAEAAALRDYTLKYAFDVTISYHSSGSIIYYEYGNKEQVNTLSKSLGNAVSAVTGYSLEGNFSGSCAGYKDWAMDELEIPSLTIEIGVGDSPLSLRECYSIFMRNQKIFPAIADWLQN